jgi:hypothetical protein
MATNTYSNYNKWKASKIYGSFEVKDLISSTGTVLDSGIIICKDINSSGTISGNSSLLSTENSTKLATTQWVKALSYITSSALSSYQLISGMSSYLTTATASTTYQTITGMSNYLTTATASTTYQTIAGMSNYLTVANASSTYHTISAYNTSIANYLTTTLASSTYQTIAGMSSYLTVANASSTYQTISGMSNYLTTASLSSYKTITSFNTDIANYLTIANASSTYQTLAGMSNYVLSSSLASFAFSGNPTITSTQLASTENSTKIPTTQWVKSVVNSLSVSSTTDIYCNSIDVSGNIATGSNVGVGNICSVGNLDCLNTINCDNIKVNYGCNYNFRNVGYFTSANFQYETNPPLPFIPLSKSIITNLRYYCGSIDVQNLLYNNYPNVWLMLYPTYKLVMFDIVGIKIFTVDNTNGTDIIYTAVTANLNTGLGQIIIYYNNIPIL